MNDEGGKGFLKTKNKNDFVALYYTSQEHFRAVSEEPITVEPTQNSQSNVMKPIEVRRSSRLK